ncbi:Uncharacterized protein OBRU01_18050 [Operophtera brumata]|uniref:Uncharacterized protein n=1 Tax=Operophtera brumata TaxID=104452 RepID=A0A0L7KZ95_OPEBR|nr:Uncharacterized protein OBRU01_18050 [Operophtera brumata]
MKDLVQIWNRVSNRQYSNNVTDRELNELTNNRLKVSDIDKSNFEGNLGECEGLNKFEDIDFNDVLSLGAAVSKLIMVQGRRPQMRKFRAKMRALILFKVRNY